MNLSPKRNCPVRGCTSTPTRMMMCKKHLKMIPAKLRDRTDAAHLLLQQVLQVRGEAWKDAVEAVESIQEAQR